MSLHRLLKRQLTRLNLSEDNYPCDIKAWQDLLQRINNSYIETDQERYLLERSTEISSREMNELNEKLEKAQQIAHLGYWFHDLNTMKNAWSRELYSMFGLDYSKPVPNIPQIIELIHEDDRERLKKLIDDALNKGVGYEAEVRFKNLKTDEYNWYLIIGKPFKSNGNSVSQLAGVAMDITRRKQIEEEVQSLNQRLLISARRAGMADVATSILHNVGNVLNSAIVSLALIVEYIEKPNFSKLFVLNKMIQDHSDNLADYFSNDQKGKLIPQYLPAIIKELENIQHNIIEEAGSLNEHMQHLKDITSMQEGLSGVYGSVEHVSIPGILEIAMEMCVKNIESKKIMINKEFEKCPTILTDKSKVLQILINLIQNAKESIVLSKPADPKININIKKSADNNIIISITDNGLGIEPKNLGNIFSFGFTTKKNGHGFGLHSSALTAKELGGQLEVASEGAGKGATFTLTLPLIIPKRSNKNEPEKQISNYSY